MKALSLTQPWATLVAISAKQIETRSWQSAYRGTLAIHATARKPRDWDDFIWNELFVSVLHGAGYLRLPSDPCETRWKEFPHSAIVAVCELTATYQITRNGVRHYPIADQLLANAEWRGRTIMLPPANGFPDRNSHEFSFGDYAVGRYAWILTDMHVLKTPVPCKGALSLWDVPAEIEMLIGKQMNVT